MDGRKRDGVDRGEERSDVRALITMDATVVRVSGAGVSVKAVALYANVTVGSCWV